jgi:pre-mRNA-splicing factor ATP-dependent RNA helicase DHX15/PRP43
MLSIPNVWLRPNNKRREADAAKELFTVPESDHLTLLNVYNQYILSEYWPFPIDSILLIRL